MVRRESAVRWVMLLALVFCCAIPRVALANDILLGVFFTSDRDHTNSIYASYDGVTMKRIATAYDTQGYDGGGASVYFDSQGRNHYAQVDPSIMYYKGKFWSLSGWNRYDDKFWPMISYSTDLVHWTHPEGEGMISGTRGISLDVRPSGCASGFDTVAPAWFVSSNGSPYIVFSAGYYGAFHGQPMVDRMQSYIVKVEALDAGEGSADGGTKYLYPSNLTFRAGTARRLNIPGNSSADANYIDGALYADNGKDYLIIKQGGLTNQLYVTNDINSNNWSSVNSSVSYGYEGPSIAKANGIYYLSADHVISDTADGVRMFTSNSLNANGAWPLASTSFVDKSGNACAVRHGSLLGLKEGTPEWSVANNLLGGESAPSKWQRLAGDGRYDTMAAIVSAGFKSSSWAVVATGASFPDAISASALAGIKKCPIILTNSENLASQARAKLTTLGVKSVFIMGGTGAVSAAVENDIKALGISVIRLSGQDRADTSVKAMQEVQASGSKSNTVVVATGKSFPDSLSIGPWSYKSASPILLVSGGKLTDAEVAAIKANANITKVVIVGGTGVVSDDVKAQLGSTYSYERLWGNNRYETSKAIAVWETEPSRGIQWTNPAVATGKAFPDALAGAALCGEISSVMVVADKPDDATVALLGSHKANIKKGYVLGGTGAVSPSLAAAIEDITR